MFVAPEDDPRSEGGFTDERSTLVAYLRDYRLTIELKCAGLDAEGMARRSVPPSNMSLLGLVRHLSDAERAWFRRTLAALDVPWLYRREDDKDAAFNDAVADPDVVASAWAAWRQEVRFAETFVDEAPNLDISGVYRDGKVISLREVLVHMIEEYARHAGHADLLRERVDGRVGQ
ncbi:MAG: DinB family protein [Acidimicrobiales bacterium]